MRTPSIRAGDIRDAEAISVLVSDLAREFIVGEFSAQGRDHFLRQHAPDMVAGRLAGDYRFYVAEDRGEVVGVAAIRANAHLYYLFVAKAYQGAGLAQRLWSVAKEYSLASGNPGRFTVNASNYAVRVYESLGFQRTQPTRETSGVLFNPMEYVVDRRPAA